jgi:hypothetical protein
LLYKICNLGLQEIGKILSQSYTTFARLPKAKASSTPSKKYPKSFLPLQSPLAEWPSRQIRWTPTLNQILSFSSSNFQNSSGLKCPNPKNCRDLSSFIYRIRRPQMLAKTISSSELRRCCLIRLLAKGKEMHLGTTRTSTGST